MAHNAVNDGVLAEEDDLAGCGDDEALDAALDRDVLEASDQRILLALAVRLDALERRTGSRLVDDADRARLEQGLLEVVDEVVRVLDSNAETDQVLR